MDAFIITMALSARAIQHGAHRHDRRGIYRCVLFRFRGRIEIDHSYGLRCRGLCCHSRHSTRGPAGTAARQPAHSCCAGSGSTNHSSADRIVVNSYNIYISIHNSVITIPADVRDCFYYQGLILIPAWRYTCIHYNMGRIYLSIPKLQWCIPHFTGHVISYPCRDYS